MSDTPEHDNPHPDRRQPAASDELRAGGAHRGDVERESAPSGDGRSAAWSRRRFGQAAMASAPVLMTLHSRPLQAAAANCTVSGWVSGNTSLHHELEDCGGFTPGYWQGPASKTQNSGWRVIHEERLDSNDGFPGLTYTVGGVPATLQDAVEGPGQTPFDGIGQDERQLVRFATAALLNARFNRPPYPLNETRVRDLLAIGLAGGGTTPGGDFLTDAQVKAYLENTMSGEESWGPTA